MRTPTSWNTKRSFREEVRAEGGTPDYAWGTCPPMNPGMGNTTVPLAVVEVSLYGMYYGVAGLNR